MKMIKFDLPIDGVKVSTLDELRDHFTTEIIAHFRSGLLAKWLRSRGLTDELAGIETLSDGTDFVVLKELSKVFNVEADDDAILAATSDATGQARAIHPAAQNCEHTKEFFQNIALIIDLAIDYSIRTIPLFANEGGAVCYDDDAKFSTGELLAWTGGKEENNIYAPASGVLIDKFNRKVGVNDGDIIGWMKISSSPEDYKKDLYGLYWMIIQRERAVNEISEAIESTLSKISGSDVICDQLKNVAELLNAASAEILSSYKNNKDPREIKNSITNPLAKVIVFRK